MSLILAEYKGKQMILEEMYGQVNHYAVYSSQRNLEIRGLSRMADILTVEQVAQELQVNVKTVYQWIKDKRLKAANIGTPRKANWRIERRDLDEFLAQGKT
jgi:excisionase family DNA binding protein